MKSDFFMASNPFRVMSFSLVRPNPMIYSVIMDKILDFNKKFLILKIIILTER